MLMTRAPHSIWLSDAARGLGQQMVFWGHDVRHGGGNDLTRHGLARTKSPGLAGTSCYSIEWEDGLIELHGAVVSWTHLARASGVVDGLIFCRERGRIDLWQGEGPPIPGREHGETGSAEQRWLAFRPFLRWLVNYEQWVLAQLGPAWRPACWRAIKRLPKGKPWLPPELALKWWKLALDDTPPRSKGLFKPP